jgi:hypothetical protein
MGTQTTEGIDPSQVDQDELTHSAGLAFNHAMRFVTRAVVVWLLAILFMFGTALGLIYVKVDSIDTTVTSHNVELSDTLTAACVLIRSDPTLPVPAGCPPATKPVTHAGH